MSESSNYKIWTDTSARLHLLVSRCATADVTRGGFEGMGSAPLLEFHEGCFGACLSPSASTIAADDTDYADTHG